MLEGMDVETLAALVACGNLQWYEPRPEQDKFESVVGLKVNAPPEKVWEVITDYPALCKIMPETYLACETEYRDGNTVKNNQKGQTTVIKFEYKYDIIDIVHEDPPYHLHVNTIAGLEKRELDMIIIPREGGRSSLFFMRYYLNLAALGMSMQAVLAVMPMTEPPTSVGANNYHSRAYKNEAEARVGYVPPPEPKPLTDIKDLDLATLRLIDDKGGGLIRETPKGKTIDALAWTFIDASPGRVWEVLVDFENYEKTFPGATAKILAKDENTVVLDHSIAKFSVLIFSFDYRIKATYHLDPPHHLFYEASEGTYQGSHGDFMIRPLEGGKKTLLFHRAGVNLERDQSFTARFARSGAFPLENMLNMMGAQAALAHVKMEPEKMEKEDK
jgi:carbon monoxide dehydrogenase subunit G